MTNTTSVRWAFNWSKWNPTEQEFKHAISCLQLDEKVKLGKFVFRKEVRASLVGRLLIRKFINDYLNIPYDNISLTRDLNNRPMLLNPPRPIDFNISHQGEYTVLAGELRNIKVGVDVMKLEYTGGKSLSEFFRIMNRNFSLSEWNEIKGRTSESEQIKMFCRHWALKESYVKALGVGLVVDLQQLNFQTFSELSEGEIINDTVLYKDGVKQDWIFEETLIDSHHCAAVALLMKEMTNKLTPIRYEKLNFNELIKNSIALHPEDDNYAKSYFLKSEKP